ncbi:MAG: FGGY family carbohydrate kinase [Phycisphaerales bacterium]
MSRLLGIDAGTTAMKAELYDETGRCLAFGIQEYGLSTSPGGIAETDPEIYWSSLKSVLKQIYSFSHLNNHEVTALAISSQGESFVVIDNKGKPLRNTIVWLDSRSQKEAKVIEQKFGREKIYHTTGCPEVNATWASTKLLWLREHESDLFKKIHKILFIEDYLIYRLTGNFAGNGALYCSSLLYDINKNTWWKDMVDFIGIKSSQLPSLYPSGVKVGILKDQTATELGFSNKPIVVSAGMDQACSCIGTGNITSGIVTENTGSSLNLSVTTDIPIFDLKLRVPCQTHAISNKFIYLPWCSTGGIILKWFRDNLCQDHIKSAEYQNKNSYDLLTEGLAQIPPGSGSLVILPHFSGAMSPEMDSDACGVVFGLNLSTKREHITKAILESVAYMSRANFELIQEAGVEIKDIILAGGASNSTVWNQIKADVLGRPVKTIKNKESGCLGAAILAGVGAEVFSSIEEACKLIIKDDVVYSPNNENNRLYDKYYDIYNQLYCSLKPIFKKR